MTIFWNVDAAARAGLSSEEMLRLSAASKQPSPPARQPTRASTGTPVEIVYTQTAIRAITQRYPALFGQQPDA